MTVRRCKGTVLSKGVANVLTAVSQVIGIDLPTVEVETFEADTLDNTDAGIIYKPTGRVEGGSLGFELFYDPYSHTALEAIFAAPTTTTNWSVTFVGGGAWAFDCVGFSLGGTVALKDGLKGKATAKLTKVPTFTAGGS
jgi:hypothetical protein